jgi:general secretion pathway protein G
MKNPTRRGTAAFTLLEIMTVISIIVILAGLILGSMSFVAERQKFEKARVQIKLLENAIEEYKMDMGEYPGLADNTPVEGDVSEELIQSVVQGWIRLHKHGHASR